MTSLIQVVICYSISRGLTVAQANSLIHERGRNELPKATQKPWINVLCRSLFTGIY